MNKKFVLALLITSFNLYCMQDEITSTGRYHSDVTMHRYEVYIRKGDYKLGVARYYLIEEKGWPVEAIIDEFSTRERFSEVAPLLIERTILDIQQKAGKCWPVPITIELNVRDWDSIENDWRHRESFKLRERFARYGKGGVHLSIKCPVDGMKNEDIKCLQEKIKELQAPL